MTRLLPQGAEQLSQEIGAEHALQGLVKLALVKKVFCYAAHLVHTEDRYVIFNTKNTRATATTRATSYARSNRYGACICKGRRGYGCKSA
jgi:hypothetical protein